jgi:hypothetical protein
MVVKVQYDAFNRTFRLVDSEFKTLLEGDALYDLAIPLMFEDADEEFFLPANTLVAHA